MKIVLDTPEQIAKWREERKRLYYFLKKIFLGSVNINLDSKVTITKKMAACTVHITKSKTLNRDDT